MKTHLISQLPNFLFARCLFIATKTTGTGWNGALPYDRKTRDFNALLQQTLDEMAEGK